MDEIAIYEIEQALRRAKARMRARRVPLVCMCGTELEVTGNVARCWGCGKRYSMA
jgi:ribosomal protein L39E